MEDLFQKFKKQFVNEIFGLLETLETDLLALEKTPNDSQLIDSVFRAMHTIKGTSAMYGYKHISDFTHRFESIYQYLRESKATAEKGIIDISLASLDHIKCLISDEELADQHNISKNKELLEAISNYSLPEVTTVNLGDEASFIPEQIQEQTWYILLRTDEQIFSRGISMVNIFSDLANLGTYHIHRIPVLSNQETETWGIVLISSKSIDTIKDVFIFIEDNCQFVLLKEGDLKDEDAIRKFAESQISLMAEIKAIEEMQDIEIKEPQNTEVKNKDKIKVPSQSSPKLKTSLLIAEAAKQNLKRISVDSGKLDYLMYLVSELITLNSKLLQTTRDDYYEKIRPQIEHMESLTKLFRENALEIRLVPLGDMVLKFQRLVRDLSNQLDKKINFISQGTDIELDKTTFDLISEPIIHIIRNCVDHGIELPAERIKKGKSETGTIKISANNVGNYIQITIDDDGKGLDLDSIREKAISRGIIKQSDNLSKQELCNLIFESGVTTSKNITNLSGRGVGMDVVKRKMTELRGEVQIDTEKDKGTSFGLKIQQSIAILDTLLFRVQNTYFILPLTDIECCISTSKALLIKNQNTGTLDYNEKMIPFLDLRTHFNLGGTYPEKVKTLILKEGGQYIGLLSDEILGEQQAVLKPLGQFFDNDTGITAVSQHGNGEWAYMLNAHQLHQKLKLLSNQRINNIEIG
jgi:two-component system chemotaxis sensor kinase CheA